MLMLPDILADFLQISATFNGDHIEQSAEEECPVSRPKHDDPQFSGLLSARAADFRRPSFSFSIILLPRHTSELRQRWICLNSSIGWRRRFQHSRIDTTRMKQAPILRPALCLTTQRKAHPPTNNASIKFDRMLLTVLTEMILPKSKISI
jgi:hypothetical protein